MHQTITAKELRTNFKEITERASSGESFTVIYRSVPAFEINPPREASRQRRSEESIRKFRAAIGIGTATDVVPGNEKEILRKRLIEKYGR